ncbi:MAG: DUF302 domain-containing protein [bacterium]
MKDFHYTRSSQRSVVEALEIVQKASVQENFGVLHVHDVRETLKKKGFDTPPAFIVEICKPEVAQKLIQVDPLVLLFLPCKIAIFSEGGETVISALTTAVPEHYLPGVDFSEFHPGIEQSLRNIVDAAR